MSDSSTPHPDRDRGEIAVPVLTPEVPVASPITPIGLAPSPGDPSIPIPDPGPGPGILEPPIPTEPVWPQIKFCGLDFRDGCYALTIRLSGLWPLHGTLRVDRAAPDSGPDGVIVSGDLYRGGIRLLEAVGGATAAETTTPGTSPRPSGSVALAASLGSPVGRWWRPRIPIFARSKYDSYLKGTGLSVPRWTLGSRCQVTLDADQFDYSHPPAGQHEGSFPSSASRSVRLVLDPMPAPFLASLAGGPYYEGRILEGGIDKGSVTLAWVSPFLRRGVLEIDTLTGAVAPGPVPDPSGTGTEYFDTVFSQAGWDLDVQEDQINVSVPTGVTPTACWSSGNLHNLMASVRRASTNLDAEWRTHLIVVPAAMGCSRGVMYDQIDVPREGSASFSDDGYPTSHSSNFGSAANGLQRNFPRAFLRSATHEVTHAFNQIHQENETAADNSIMTTTPSVADVLGGPTTGAPGVFPDQINLGFNSTVRNHLAHMPDPVVRPGGWPFASWFGSGSPQASDRQTFESSELSVEVSVEPGQAAFGTPVTVTWTMTNNSDSDLTVPNDVRLEGLFATMTVTNDRGMTRPVRPFVIECETVRLEPLAPGDSRSASHRVFWSSAGFALDRPGRHVLTVTVSWSAGGVPVGADGAAEVWVDYPVNGEENADAALVMHPEVGKWVALAGDAYHLTEAVDRLATLAPDGRKGVTDRGDGGSRVAAAFAELLPTRAAAGRADNAAKKAPAQKRTAKKSAAKKGAAKKGSR